MRRRLSAVILAVVLAAIPAFAQIEGHPDPVPPKRASMVKFGVGLGLTPSWLFLDLAPINGVLTAANAATFEKGSLYLTGIHGYAYVLFVPNLRVGGLGAGGSMESSALEQGTNVRRNVKLGVTMGGVTVDYVIPVVPRIDLTVGGMIGGGSMKIAMNRDDGTAAVWGDLWSEYGSAAPAANYTRTLEGSFFLYVPTVGIEAAVTRWLGVRVAGSYTGTAGNSWRLDDRFDVTGVPDDIRPRGFTLTTGIYLGTFMY